MRRVAFFAILMLVAFSVSAQRVYRSEFTVYDVRDDALSRDHSRTTNHIVYMPLPLGSVGNIELIGTKIEIPASWKDYNVYLHIENTIKAYDVAVNGKLVASTSDPYTPADYLISPYLIQGVNEVVLLLRTSEYGELNADAQNSLREQAEGCYLFAQHRTSVYDFDAAITADSEGKLHLELDVIVGNDFNYEEPISVGYDVYTPERKLVDYAVREIKVAGRSRDTLKVRLNLGAESRYLWSEKQAGLYRTTLYIKRNGKPFEYLTTRVGAGVTTYADGKILRNGEAIDISLKEYNARTNRSECRKDILAFKVEGINTLMPDTPQPSWFYDLCDDLGMYVIESTSINPRDKSDDRKVGGTPSNNPELVEEYIKRVKSMYYRTRNRACIIGYSLGGKHAGNGYCMYKAYQWLKSVEKNRPVICRTADGEWNTDVVLPKAQ